MQCSRRFLLARVLLSDSRKNICTRCLSSSGRNLFLNDLLLSKAEPDDPSKDMVPASLSAALHGAGSQQEVLKLLETAGNACKLRHLLLATSRLADLRPRCLTDSIYTPDDGLYRLEAKLCSRVERLSPQEVERLLHSVSRMALALPNDDLLAELCVHLRGQVKWLDVERLSSCLHALAILRSRTLPVLERYNVLCAIEVQVLEHMDKMNGLALAKTVWSFHRLLFRSDKLWTAMSRQAMLLSSSLPSTSIATIAKCYAEHHGTLKDTAPVLKSSVEAMLHRFGTVLLERHTTKSQFSCLCGLLWSSAVLAWPTPHLASVVAHGLCHISSSAADSAPTGLTAHPAAAGCHANAASAAAAPPAARRVTESAESVAAATTAAEKKEKENEDSIGLQRQSSLLSWVLDKTSSKLGDMIKAKSGYQSTVYRALLLQNMMQPPLTMGVPTPSTAARPSAKLQPWAAMLATKKGEIPTDTLARLHVKRQTWEKAFGPVDGGRMRSAQDSRSWSGLHDMVGGSETSNLLENLSSLSTSQLKLSPRAAPAAAAAASRSSDRNASAIARSSNLVQHLQRVLDEQRRVKASRHAADVFSHDSHRRQMRVLWPASDSPFAQRLAWFDTRDGGGGELSESPNLPAGAGLKQLPSTLTSQLSQVTVLWKSSSFSTGHSLLPDDVHDELHRAGRRQHLSDTAPAILTPVSECMKELGLPCRLSVSLDCYDIDIVSDIPSVLLKDPGVTMPMSLAVVLTDLISFPDRHSPGYMVLLRRYLQSRSGKDWRLFALDAAEWASWGSKEEQYQTLRSKLNKVLQ